MREDTNRFHYAHDIINIIIQYRVWYRSYLVQLYLCLEIKYTIGRLIV